MSTFLRRIAILVMLSGGALASPSVLAQTFSFTDPGPTGKCDSSGVTLQTINLSFAWSGFASPPNNVIFDLFVNGALDSALSGPVDLPAPSGNDAFVGFAPLSPPASIPYTIQIAGFPAVNGVATGIGASATIECVTGTATVTSLRNGILAAAPAVPLPGTLPLLLAIAIVAVTSASWRRRGKMF